MTTFLSTLLVVVPLVAVAVMFGIAWFIDTDTADHEVMAGGY